MYNIFKNADLLIPDGIGIVLAVRLLHGAKLNRVPGVDLMKDICRMAEQESKSIFLYGARETVNKSAADRLQHEFPRLQIAGRSDGYVSESQMPELVRHINDSGAVILFLALGSPRQEKWFASHAPEEINRLVTDALADILWTPSPDAAENLLKEGVPQK